METKTYTVRVSGELDAAWKDYFAPFVYSRAGMGETVFTGTFEDQPELIEALKLFQSVNLTILSVTALQGDKP